MSIWVDMCVCVNQVGKVGRVQVRPAGKGEGLELLAHTHRQVHTHTHRDTDTDTYTHKHFYIVCWCRRGDLHMLQHLLLLLWLSCGYQEVFVHAGWLQRDGYSISTKTTKKFNLIKPAHKYDHKSGDILLLHINISKSYYSRGNQRKNRGCPRYTLLSSSCNVNAQIGNQTYCRMHTLHIKTYELRVKRTQPMERSQISMVELCWLTTVSNWQADSW